MSIWILLIIVLVMSLTVIPGIIRTRRRARQLREFKRHVKIARDQITDFTITLATIITPAVKQATEAFNAFGKVLEKTRPR